MIENHSVGSACRWTLEGGVDYLRRREVDHSRYSAEILLAACLSLPRARLYLPDSRSISREEEDGFKRLLSLRGAGFPLAYLTGSAGFYNLELRSDRRALIPRPETELVVDESLARLQSFSAGSARILDLGCGGGAIALALAAETEGTGIFASDLSAPALELARENAHQLGLSGRVTFRQGDLFRPWRDSISRGFDLIVSNPPYISAPEMARLPDEVRLHEPRLALSGGEDGLDVIRRLIEESPGYLKPGGFLIFEIGSGQGERTRRLLSSSGYFGPPELIKDYNRHDRVVTVRRNTKNFFRRNKLNV